MKGINNMISGLGPNKYITIISLLLAAFVIIYLGYNLTNDISEKARSQKKFVENIKDAKIPIEVTGNDVIPSKNGYQFTYSFWMFINNWEYNYGKLKHVFHKGNDNFTFASPGIWLHPKENTMRVYMNTFKHINEFVDVENLPINNILCDLDFIFFIKISSCKETKATMLSILCKEGVLPVMFKAKFNLAYDLILICFIQNLFNP